MSALLEVHHLTRLYADHCAVDNISFTLKKGEVLGFLGPNGAGKSTTMKMICGNLAPTIGEIKINGYDMIDEPIKAKSQLGYLPEIPPLYPELTVNEYLDYCAKLHGIPANDIEQKIALAKQRCGLTDMGERLLSNLSKGYQQRAGIAQAIIHQPPVIVLDEPTVGLDPIQMTEIRALIRDLGKDHSVIISTHILSEVQHSCTRVLIIDHGELKLNEPIETLNGKMSASSLIVQFETELTENDLLSLPFVERVEMLPERRYRLFHQQHQSIANDIAQHAIKQGWGIIELTPEKHNLEQVFLDFTQQKQKTTDE